MSHGNTSGKSRQAEAMARPKPWGRTGQVCGRTQEALGLKHSEQGASWPLQLCVYPENHGHPREGWDLLWAGHPREQVIRLAVLLEDEGPRLLGRGGVSPPPCPALLAKTAQRTPGPWSSPPGCALMQPPHPCSRTPSQASPW